MKYWGLVFIVFLISSCSGLFVTLTIVNKTEEICTEVYLKKTDEAQWGGNLLTEDLLQDDDFTRTDLSKDKYDCRCLFSESGYIEYPNIDLRINEHYELQLWNREE